MATAVCVEPDTVYSRTVSIPLADSRGLLSQQPWLETCTSGTPSKKPPAKIKRTFAGGGVG